MENMIKIGSVVKTSQHQHQMSVHSIAEGVAVCNWFDKNEDGEWNDIHEEKYPIEELEYVRD